MLFHDIIFNQPLEALVKLSKALESAFSRLVGGVGDKLYSVTRKDAHKEISRSSSTKGKQLYTYCSLDHEVKGRHMEALMVTLEENPDQEMSVHDGEEFIYVIEGTVYVKIDEDEFELEPGETAYIIFPPHRIWLPQKQAGLLSSPFSTSNLT